MKLLAYGCVCVALLLTAFHLITSTPELSQRLFGLTSKSNANTAATALTTNAAPTNLQLVHLTQNLNKTSASTALSSSSGAIASIEFNDALTAHLPAVLSLQIKNSNLQNITQSGIVTTTQQQQKSNAAAAAAMQTHSAANQQQQHHQHNAQSVPHNPNSLLKQQLRANLKDLIDITITNASTTTTTTTTSTQQQQQVHQDASASAQMSTDEACSALQSLASAAERQAQQLQLQQQQQQTNIQPPSANNLHHQFLLHMAANPILKPANDFFQQQQQQLQQHHHHHQQQQQQQVLHRNVVQIDDDPSMDLLMDQQSDKSDPEMLTLADENAGLDYSTASSMGQCDGSQQNENYEQNVNAQSGDTAAAATTRKSKSKTGKPIQRRRIRRKAESSIDDQAEQLTEMSVRGLDLFRYASITEGVYKCMECAKENMMKTFKNKYSFQRHAFLYHEGKHRKVFPCPLCGKEFSRPDKMKNHMKMTHESFVANKDMTNFNPLNYLISAAISSSGSSSSMQQQQQNAATTNAIAQQLQAQNPALSIILNNAETNEEDGPAAGVGIAAANNGLNLTQSSENKKSTPPPPPTLDHKPFKFPNDIEIKNEIVISPSPSPPHVSSVLQQSRSDNTLTTISITDSLTSYLKSAAAAAAAAASPTAQRLEEVK